MPVTFVTQSFFLQALAWAIINSLWQSAILWLLYYMVDKTVAASSIFRYVLSLTFLFLCFALFLFTGFSTYAILLNGNQQPWLFQQISLSNSIVSFFPFVSMLYVSLLGLRAIKLLTGYFQIRFLTKDSLLKTPLKIRLFVNATKEHLGIKRKVGVWLSSHVNVPSVTGFLKPVILLPIAMVSYLSPQQVDAVLLHELAHIKRNDFILNVLQSIVGIILCFNPFAIILNNAAKKERENCCDDWVVTFKFNKKEYASALMILEEQRHQSLMLAMAATNNKKMLLSRIQRLVAAHTPGIEITKFQKINLFVFAVLPLTVIGLITNPSFKNKHLSNANIPVTATKNFSSPALLSSLPVTDKITATQNTNPPPKKIPKIKSVTSPKQESIHNEASGYVLTLVNDEALSPDKNLNDKAVNVANIEKDSIRSVIVKIEDEQSGKAQKNSYYFEVNSDHIKTDIKPLMIIKKYTPSFKLKLKKTPFLYPELNKKRRVTT